MKRKIKSFLKTILNFAFDLSYGFMMFPARYKKGRKLFDKEELRQVHRALLSQNLFSQGGTTVTDFEKKFAQTYNVPYAASCSSGTAAIHTALGVLDLNPADEVITAPITDMGTIIPILYQNAIPVFADVDSSYTMDPQDIEKKITPRTKAIIAVHLFGNACNMDAIMKIAQSYNIPVIEDCAQAHLTEYKGRLLGTIGDIGCFSFQQAKHMTCGDGGMAITSNKNYYEKMKLFVDKNYARKGWGARAYYGLSPNYRMNGLTAAVGIAQLGKLKAVVEKRNRLGAYFTDLLKDNSELITAAVTEGTKHSYWLYPLSLKSMEADLFANELLKEGLKVIPGYTVKPIYLCTEALTNKKTYGKSECPFSCQKNQREFNYREGLCPRAEKALEHLICILLDESWDKERVNKTAQIILKTVKSVKGESAGAQSKETAGMLPSLELIHNRRGRLNVPYAVDNFAPKKVRVAIVGCGNISKWHIDAYRNNPNTELCAFVDTDTDKAQNFARQFAGQAFSSHKSLLNGQNINAASICTIPSTHKAIAMDLLSSGIHVLCEKPLAVSVLEAQEMTKKARENNLHLITAYKFRFFEEVIKAKELLSQAGFGKIVNFRLMFAGYLDMSNSWFAKKEFSGGGVAADNGSHALDLIRYLFGEVESVSVHAQNLQNLDVEDTARIQVYLKNGASGTIDLSWSAAVASRSYLEIYAEDGALALDPQGVSYKFKMWADWKRILTQGGQKGAFNSQINHFVEAVSSKKRPSVITIDDGLRSQVLIDAVYESMRRKERYALV